MKNILRILVLILIQSTIVFAQSTRSQEGQASFAPSARAGALFDVATFYGTNEETSEPVSASDYKENESVFDIKLGYVFSYGLLLGVEYSVRNYGFTNWSTTGSASAAGLGYVFKNGFNIRGYYRFNEVFSDYRNGTGFQADIGYTHLVATNFFIGMSISHRETTFDKRDSDPTLTKFTYKSTDPMFTVGFQIK